MFPTSQLVIALCIWMIVINAAPARNYYGGWAQQWPAVPPVEIIPAVYISPDGSFHTYYYVNPNSAYAYGYANFNNIYSGGSLSFSAAASTSF